jgi:trimeric autotransporter adhesin
MAAGTSVNGNQADNSIGQAGAAYVFVRRGTTWSQQAYLKASNPGEAEEGDTFGYSVAVSGDGNTVAVGAPSEDSSATGINGNQADNSAVAAGAVYVFARNGTTWSQQAYVKSDVPAQFTAGDLFGYSVALNSNGNMLAIGAYDEGSSSGINGTFDNKLGGSGAVFVYTRTGTSWARTAFLKAKEQDRNDSTGASVAMSDDGDTIIAGAADEDSLTTGINAARSGDSGETDSRDDNSAGAVYVFVRTATTWTQQANFKASNTGKNDWFGVKVALSGDGRTVAVSATNEDSNAKGIDGAQADDSANEAGAVYLFRRSGTTWSQIAYVKGANTEEFDEFGTSVALTRDGSVMAVGARFEDSAAAGVNGNQADNALLDSGAVYVFSAGR